jgi:hypothetical protein
VKLVEEREIEIDLAVAGAVERPGRGLSRAASRLREIAEEDELRALILRARLFENLRPGVLRVFDDERDELHLLRLLGCLLHGRGRVHRYRGLPAARAVEEREEVLAREKTQHEQDDRAAASDLRTAAESEAEPTATRTAAIFDVRADSAWCPTHGVL